MTTAARRLAQNARRFAAGLAVISMTAGAVQAASAQTSQRVGFKIDGVAIVWGEETRAAALTANLPQASAQASHPIHGLLAGSGLLEPVQSAHADKAFDAPSTGAVFHVASNTAFIIEAEAHVSGAAEPISLDTSFFELAMTAIGSKAQTPGGASIRGLSIADLGVRREVYRATRRTARASGAIADQSVRFEATWGTPENAQADIVFTVYAP